MGKDSRDRHSGTERTIKLQDNLSLCEAGTEKGSRNGEHRSVWGKWQGT